jgi:hypothetical protein
MGQPVTVFQGEGMRGPVDELYITCRRCELKRILDVAKEKDPDAFYITEIARDVRETVRPPYIPLNGQWLFFERKVKTVFPAQGD